MIPPLFTPKTRPLETGLLALVILGIFWVAYQLIWMGLCTDTGWLIYAARKVWEGKTLYVDLAETNPPLIIWYNMLAVMLSPGAQSDIYVYHMLTLACISLSVWASFRIAKKSGYINYRTGLYLIAGILAMLIVMSNDEWIFAQREYLFIVFCLPYMVYSNPLIFDKSKLGKTGLFLIGSWAAFGFLLKPYFLLLFAFVELYYLFRLKRVDLSRFFIGVTIFAWGLVYLGAVYVFAQAYYTEILPDLVRTYSAHRVSTMVIYRRFIYGCVPLVVILPYLISNPKLLRNNEVHYAFVLVLTGIGLIFSQYKGWEYTYFPYRLSIYFLICVCLKNSAVDIHRISLRHRIFNYAMAAAFAFGIIAPDSITKENPLLFFIVFIPLFINLLLEIAYGEKAPTANKSWNTICLILHFVMLSLLIRFFVPNGLNYSIIVALLAMACCIAAIFGNQIMASLRADMSMHSAHMLRVMALLLVVLIPIYTYKYNSNKTPTMDRLIVSRLYKTLQKENPKTLYMFTANFYPGFPLANKLNVTWGTRYHHLWMAPAMYRHSNCKPLPELADVENRLFSNLAIDLTESQPDILLFDSSPKKFINRRTWYNYYRCMKQDPVLKGIFSNYRKIAQVNICIDIHSYLNCSYDVYKKIRSF